MDILMKTFTAPSIANPDSTKSVDRHLEITNTLTGTIPSSLELMNSIAIQHHNPSLNKPLHATAAASYKLSETDKNHNFVSQTKTGSSTEHDKFKRHETGSPVRKEESMFNSSNNSGGNFGHRDNNNNNNNNNFQRHFPGNMNANANNTNSAQGASSSSNPYRNLANSSLLMRSQQQFQQNAQNVNTSQQAQQQQRLLQMTRNEFEVQQIANNIKESLFIKQRLESIKMLQFEQAAKQSNAMRGMGNKSIPSISNTSVIPPKKREDEMTKPDLSTLAETAVAVASASTRNRSNSHSGMMGMENKNAANNRIAALLASPAGAKRGPSPSNNATMEALRREMNTPHHNMHMESKFKRNLDEMIKGNPGMNTTPSWLWNSPGSFDGGPTSMMDQLRAQHHQMQLLQRRNSLPASSSTSNPSSELRSMKKQRVMEQRFKDNLGSYGITDAMEQMRQLDSSLKMNMNNDSNNNSSILAKMMSTANEPERRLSLASNATAPNPSTHNSFNMPTPSRSMNNNPITPNSLDALNKLNKMSGGFPMPKYHHPTTDAGKNNSSSSNNNNNSSSNNNNNVPVEITPDFNKDVVDVTGSDGNSSSASSRKQRGGQQNEQQLRYMERIGGFPMPPLYRQQGEGEDTAMDTVINSPKNNLISSHIKKAHELNAHPGGISKASRPPALDSYKRIWRDIRVVAGDDPEVDERLRKEVFARKLQRGEIFSKAKRKDKLAALTAQKKRPAGSKPGQDDIVI